MKIIVTIILCLQLSSILVAQEKGALKLGINYSPISTKLFHRTEPSGRYFPNKIGASIAYDFNLSPKLTINTSIGFFQKKRRQDKFFYTYDRRITGSFTSTERNNYIELNVLYAIFSDYWSRNNLKIGGGVTFNSLQFDYPDYVFVDSVFGNVRELSVEQEQQLVQHSSGLFNLSLQNDFKISKRILIYANATVKRNFGKYPRLYHKVVKSGDAFVSAIDIREENEWLYLFTLGIAYVLD